MKDVQRTAIREAGFTEAQTSALAMALEPLATKEDLRSTARALRGDIKALRGDFEVLRGDFEVLRGDLKALRGDLELLRNDLRWMKWVGGAIGVALLTEMASGLFF